MSERLTDADLDRLTDEEILLLLVDGLRRGSPADTARSLRDMLTPLVEEVRELRRQGTELRTAGDVLEAALESYVEITSCECDECRECGRMPRECSDTPCSETCSCRECDHCYGEYARECWEKARAAGQGVDSE